MFKLQTCLDKLDQHKIKYLTKCLKLCRNLYESLAFLWKNELKNGWGLKYGRFPLTVFSEGVNA